MTSFALAGLAQLLLTIGGSLFPDESGLYGAPIPVGQSCGSNLLFGCDPSFFLPFWLVNLLVTGGLVLVMAVLLKGRLGIGVITVTVAVLFGYGLVILRFNVNDLLDLRINPLLMWAWVLVVLAVVWGIRRRTS